MKTLLLSVCALICAASSVLSQEIRLDSLWAKFGGVGAMSFSPDSKTLILAEPQKLAGGSGTIRFYDPATGIEKDSIPGTEYYDVRYTPDGKRIVQVGFGGEIKLYNAETYKLEKSVNAPQNAGYIDFSADGNIIVSAGSNVITVVDITEGVVKAVINRPYQYSTGPNKTEYYRNGKVCFSADGRYVIGKYANALVRWDWQTVPDKPETLIPLIPNYAVLGFSPDKSLFVLQSNYLWSIGEKKQIPVEGINNYASETAYGFASTFGGSCMVVTGKEDHAPRFVNTATKRSMTTTPLKYNLLMTLSPDSSFFAYQYGDGQTHLHKVHWGITGVIEKQGSLLPVLFIQPMPAIQNVRVILRSEIPLLHCVIRVVNTLGQTVSELYQGDLAVGEQTFEVPTESLPAGTYHVRVEYDAEEISQSFIIIK